MTRTGIMVHLTDQTVRELDEEVARDGVSRSALIRQAVDELLAARRSDVQRYIQGYEAIPQGTLDQWDDLSDSNDRAGHDLALRLDSEEAGLE